MFVFVCVCVIVCICLCVCVSLVIQHAKRMRHTILSVACRTLLCISTSFHKRRDFRKKVIESKMFILIFSGTFVRNIPHSRHKPPIYCHIYIKVPGLLSEFNET